MNLWLSEPGGRPDIPPLALGAARHHKQTDGPKGIAARSVRRSGGDGGGRGARRGVPGIFSCCVSQLRGRFSFWGEEDGVNCPKNFLCLNSSRFVRAATLICCGQASWEYRPTGSALSFVGKAAAN